MFLLSFELLNSWFFYLLLFFIITWKSVFNLFDIKCISLYLLLLLSFIYLFYLVIKLNLGFSQCWT